MTLLSVQAPPFQLKFTTAWGFPLGCRNRFFFSLKIKTFVLYEQRITTKTHMKAMKANSQLFKTRLNFWRFTLLLSAESWKAHSTNVQGKVFNSISWFHRTRLIWVGRDISHQLLLTCCHKQGRHSLDHAAQNPVQTMLNQIPLKATNKGLKALWKGAWQLVRVTGAARPPSLPALPRDAAAVAAEAPRGVPGRAGPGPQRAPAAGRPGKGRSEPARGRPDTALTLLSRPSAAPGSRPLRPSWRRNRDRLPGHTGGKARREQLRGLRKSLSQAHRAQDRRGGAGRPVQRDRRSAAPRAQFNSSGTQGQQRKPLSSCGCRHQTPGRDAPGRGSRGTGGTVQHGSVTRIRPCGGTTKCLPARCPWSWAWPLPATRTGLWSWPARIQPVWGWDSRSPNPDAGNQECKSLFTEDQHKIWPEFVSLKKDHNQIG